MTSKQGFGGPGFGVRGRGMFAQGAAASRQMAHGAGDVATGLKAFSNQDGFVKQQSNRYFQQVGLRHGQEGGVADGLRKGEAQDGQPATHRPSERFGTSHGNTAAVQKRQAAGELNDDLVDGVLTGDIPGDTGMANTKKTKSRKKPDPNQESLF